MKNEIYFLSSLDSVRFEKTRQCVFVSKLHFDSGKECALVKLSPKVSGSDYGINGELEYFILASRHEGEKLFTIKSFPCFVFIARPLVEDMHSHQTILNKDVEIIAWGELYRTRDEADNHVFD